MNATLGRYRLIAELGRGGMGTVYLAVSHGPGGFSKLVVIKQLRPVFAEDANFTSMFLEEARLAARLHHPNIVQTNEVVCHPQDGYFMVMEYLEGASLRRIVRRLRARGDESARALYARAILDVLVALEYAHTLKDFDGKPLNLVHRDVNPSNVVVTHGGQVKLLDFGIAKAADSAQETRAGVLKGKLHYMPPEQMAGDRIDCRADLFAVGAMLWDALTGRKLWEGEKGLDVITSLVHGSIASPRSVHPEISEDLDRICMRALSFKPDDRYPDAGSFRADLESALGSPVMSSSELAAAMATEFLEEQERMRSLIAEQLRTADAGSPGVVLPTIASDFPPPHTGVSSDVSRTPAALAVDDDAAPRGTPGKRRPLRVALSVIAGCAAAGLIGVAVGSVLRGALRGSSTAATAGAIATAVAAPTQAGAPTQDIAERLPTPPIEPPPSSEPAASGSAEARHKGFQGRAIHREPGPYGRWPQAFASRGSTLSLEDGSINPSPPPAAPPAFPTAEHLPAPVATPAPVAPPPANTPTSSAPPVPNGTISVAAANAVVRSHMTEINRCFERGEMDQLYLKVDVTVSAAVSPDGHVTSVTTSATRGGTARLQACIHDAVQTWIFPEPAGGVPGRVTRTFSSE
jgi:eukaryotic-like serine/threonine-protein kinase